MSFFCNVGVPPIGLVQQLIGLASTLKLISVTVLFCEQVMLHHKHLAVKLAHTSLISSGGSG